MSVADRTSQARDPRDAGPLRGPGSGNGGGDEAERYRRQIVVAGFGAAGQERLSRASVVVVGAGGLGSPALLYLAAAGIGRLGIVDDDVVEISNLQRQVVHRTRDAGRPKTDSAREQLHGLNPDVKVVTHQLRLSPDNAEDVLGGYDVVLDATDSIPVRYLIDAACVRIARPHVWGAVSGFGGQASVFAFGDGPCYRCVFPAQPDAEGGAGHAITAEHGGVPSSAPGVLGMIPAQIGALQALEALKLLTGIGRPLTGRLLIYDGLAATWDVIPVRRRPDCPSCGTPAR